MARPRSEDKRNAILAAAEQVIAQEGLSAPTSKIAKAAGVAEGTLFTYFANKDDLLNQLYLQIKSTMRDTMMDSYPHKSDAKTRASHFWHKYVEWGVAFPASRKTLSQLSVSDRVTEESKAQGMRSFADINTLVQHSIAAGVLRAQPPAFVGAIMGSLAETTMDFMSREPAQAQMYADAGFQSFWNAIAAK